MASDHYKKPLIGWMPFLPWTTHCPAALEYPESHVTACAYCKPRDPESLVHEFNQYLTEHRARLAERVETAVEFALRRDFTHAEAAQAARRAIEYSNCPLDTDGDGNCGRTPCPFCGNS